VKAISLWQPWATLVVTGAKRIETRGWETLVRGELAIHAAQHWNRALAALCLKEPFARALRGTGTMPFGAVIGVVTLSGIEPVDAILDISEQERAFGNYEPGRFAWLLDNIRALPRPVPCRGHQQLFILEPRVEAQIREQLGAAA
jgi:activating signal cointegrator 1